MVSQRDPSIHAVLPLRGKVLNVIDRDIQSILSNVEIRSMINAIGIGVRQKQSIDRIRYSKIVICTDADVDGLNIRALLLGALCYLVPEAVSRGHVYVAEVPLFGQYAQKRKRGSKEEFVPIYEQSKLDSSKKFYRYKGLGSMQPEELAAVTFDHSIRRLVQVTLDNVDEVCKIVGNASYRKDLLVSLGIVS